MQVVLTGILILALVAFFARPALAAVRGGVAVAPPTIVAAADKVDPALKLDSFIKGAIKIDFSSENLLKWKFSSVKCDDVTVVTTGANAVVATTKAASVPGDPASCVYSMKVPSGLTLSVYAEIGSSQSVGITGVSNPALKSDLKTQKLGPTTEIKSRVEFYKPGANSTDTLPLYLKIDI